MFINTLIVHGVRHSAISFQIRGSGDDCQSAPTLLRAPSARVIIQFMDPALTFGPAIYRTNKRKEYAWANEILAK
jgi:hypothetical protein